MAVPSSFTISSKDTDNVTMNLFFKLMEQDPHGYVRHDQGCELPIKGVRVCTQSHIKPVYRSQSCTYRSKSRIPTV